EADDETEVLEEIETVLLRLAQVHHAQTPDRWEQITKKINKTIKNKHIDTRPLKMVLEKEGIVVPQCWVAEVVKEEAKLKVERRKDHPDNPKKAIKGVVQGKLFGGSTTKGESDAESESETEEVGYGLKAARNQSNEDVDFLPLSKHEVFSIMKLLHKIAGPRVLEEDDIKIAVEGAMKAIDELYSDLPANVVRGLSQEARIREGLGQDTLVYGEINTYNFLEVLVKLRQVHGHMMSPGGCFYDLGAGVGKTVFAAALMHNFESCYGIEVLGDIRDKARMTLKKWRNYEEAKQPMHKANTRVDFMFADALKKNGWVKEATILFVHTNFSAVD
ncbi:unnamed protein product, partial [Choristocarpus tenellus]